MDRRVQYTKRVIKDTFLALLEEKDMNSITVTEICSKADINRATFYRYYLDPYDLLKQIETEFIETVKDKYAERGTPSDTFPNFTKGILDIVLSNRKLVQILFNTNHNAYFLTEVLEIAFENCLAYWADKMPETDEKAFGYALVYAFNGALGVINYWIKNDFEDSTDYIASLISDCARHGIDGFLN